MPALIAGRRSTRPRARPSSVCGASPYSHSRAIRYQFAARAQLAHHGERHHLQAPAEEVLGRERLAPHLVERRRASGRRSRGRSASPCPGSSSSTSSRGEPPRVAAELVEDRLGRRARVVGQHPGRRASARSCSSPRPSTPSRWIASSRSAAAAEIRLNRPKSRNAMRPSSSSSEFPGCGSPENAWWRYIAPK